MRDYLRGMAVTLLVIGVGFVIWPLVKRVNYTAHEDQVIATVRELVKPECLR